MSVNKDSSLLVTMKASDSDIFGTYLVSSKDAVVVHSSFITHVGDKLYKLFHYEASRLHHHYCVGIKSYEEAGQRPPRTAIKKAAYALAADETLAKFGEKLYEEARLLKLKHTPKGQAKASTKPPTKTSIISPTKSKSASSVEPAHPVLFKEVAPKALPSSNAFELDDFELPKGEEDVIDESDSNPFA